MLLAKIVGTVVATRKDPRLVSNKLLLARPVDPKGKAEGNYLVAIDTVDAGVGDEARDEPEKAVDRVDRACRLGPMGRPPASSRHQGFRRCRQVGSRPWRRS